MIWFILWLVFGLIIEWVFSIQSFFLERYFGTLIHTTSVFRMLNTLLVSGLLLAILWPILLFAMVVIKIIENDEDYD